ncbi:L-2-amino-thiazoline-4-carboxylic acid hydrolase [Clostridium gasigenes]|uniref:L-2-amino-thiazoline-4-carboxylic acid hydrolase n=1 Tax=Clostridium gasigenes TaxID=94869 RepID=UPI001C0DB058|nr:L-2-amino-thiazoline-4-carboxylic acid hydrolase [Clostridium gasigenes]MBU3132364.1 L-2-amino-thiazoline-4-carboxylic acid hydrolase [Clostridium gasigenes]
MNYCDTKYKDLKSICIEKYGNEKGLYIYNKAEEIFRKMKDEADYRNSDVIKEHMTKKIFPVLAYYMALLEYSFSTNDAYANTLEETQKHATLSKKKNEKLGKMPFSYYLFKLCSKKVMGKNFPDEGWETEWVRYDNKEVHFNLKRCVYFEVTSQYGHPELCTVFCANDTTSFSGYLPNITFERSGTIGEGKRMCDFHFKNSKYI